MQIANIYFAYKNYINVDYGGSWQLAKQLTKKYDVDERIDRITIRPVTEDIEKSDILIKKGYYALAFNNSKISSVDQIENFYLKHSGTGCNICFTTSRSRLPNSDVHVIVQRKEDIARIAEYVEPQKARNEGALLIDEFYELLHTLLIDGKYYFATHFQKPESGARGLIIYTLEGESLKEVFTDCSEAT